MKKSPIVYAGSKRRLLKQILPLLPENVDTFIDLFCGSCTVGINAVAKRVVFCDKNEPLIGIYKEFLQHEPLEIMELIDKRIKEYNISKENKASYLAFREEYNKTKKPLDLFILLLFCFNHQLRFNKNLEFNSSFGGENSYFNNNIRGILLEFLKELKTMSCEFESIAFDKCFKERIRTEDFVYADPPYLITNANYNDKTRGYGGWDENDERLLLELLLKHHKNGGKFALSNVFYHKGRENKILKEWCEENNFYVDYLNMDYTTCVYTIAKKGNKEKTVEVLIRNYE